MLLLALRLFAVQGFWWVTNSNSCEIHKIKHGRIPCKRSALWMPIYRCGCITLRMQIICSPLIYKSSKSLGKMSPQTNPPIPVSLLQFKMSDTNKCIPVCCSHCTASCNPLGTGIYDIFDPEYRMALAPKSAWSGFSKAK